MIFINLKSHWLHYILVVLLWDWVRYPIICIYYYPARILMYMCVRMYSCCVSRPLPFCCSCNFLAVILQCSATGNIQPETGFSHRLRLVLCLVAHLCKYICGVFKPPYFTWEIALYYYLYSLWYMPRIMFNV